LVWLEGVCQGSLAVKGLEFPFEDNRRTTER
jgi:hypothetical protein